MSVNYCLPIIKSDKAEILETIRLNEAKYSYFEVWLDYVNGVDEVFIKQLADVAGEKLVLLFRRQNLEPINMPAEQRFGILKLLDKTPLLVDLDITTQAAELDYIRDNNLTLKTIASYHDYEQTPDTARLEAIIGTMDKYRPDIYKLAALCGSSEDALRLLQQLLAFKTRGQAAIVLGMGEAGLVTRVFGALWGNAMTFAPLTAQEQSAPGQLTRRQLEAVFKELGV
jgi:3-dehydroquinate dehydratase-1